MKDFVKHIKTIFTFQLIHKHTSVLLICGLLLTAFEPLRSRQNDALSLIDENKVTQSTAKAHVEETKWSVEGYLNDVSPNEKWVLYRVPDAWESDDYREGSLRILDTETGEIIVVHDKITIEDPVSYFLSDSVIAKPANGSIELYDISCRSFNSKLLEIEDDYNWLTFSVSNDRTKIALLLHDYSDRHTRKVVLRILDLVNNQQYDIGYHPFEPEGCADYATVKEILWYDNCVIYAFDGQLYYHVVGSNETILLSNHVSHHQLWGNELVFKEWGIWESKVQTFVLPGTYQKPKAKGYKTQVSVAYDGCELYQSNTLSIKQSIEPPPTPSGVLTDKYKLLIEKKK